MNLKSILSLSAVFAASVLAQDDVVSRCRALGFTEFANQLELAPQLVARINSRSDSTVWAVPNDVVLRQLGNSSSIHKRATASEMSSQANHNPPTPAAGLRRRRRKRQQGQLTPSNPLTLYTYLEDPAFVNLGPQQPGRLVSSFAGSSSPAEANLVVASGLGRSTRQISGPFKFDKGVIYGAEDFFAMPAEFSTAIQAVGTAKLFYNAVVDAGRKDFFDDSVACTIFAPVDAGNEGKEMVPDRHIICGFLGYSPQLLPGKTYYSIIGTAISITLGEDGLRRVNGIPFVQTDICNKNGPLHLIKSPL